MFRSIRSCLLRRYFFVNTGDVHTSLHHTCRGILQGGVLSLVLFNLTLISLFQHLPSTVSLSMCLCDSLLCTRSKNEYVRFNGVGDAHGSRGR